MRTKQPPPERKHGEDSAILQIAIGTLELHSHSPNVLETYARVTLEGSLTDSAFEMELSFRWRNKKWVVGHWRVCPLNVDYTPYETYNEAGKLIETDFTRLNADLEARTPWKSVDKAYRRIVREARAWAASNADEMREMQRRVLRNETQINRKDMAYALCRLREYAIEVVESRYLWTQRHGALDGSGITAREYGRLLRNLQSAANQLEQVTKRLPRRLGYPVPKAA